MPDFKNKIIKIFLNETSGRVIETGMYLSENQDFLVIENSLTKHTQYISKGSIKYVEVVKCVDEVRGSNND